MKRKSEGRTPGDLNGFLDVGSQIHGELHFEDTFRLDGKVRGRVVSRGDLVIGEKGEVEGEIDVARVFVSGVARGGIKATERIEITANGKVFADVQTKNLTIEDGAVYEGRCSMSREVDETPTPRRAQGVQGSRENRTVDPYGDPGGGGVLTSTPLPKDLI